MQQKYYIYRLAQDIEVASFNSTDAELNDFLISEAKAYQDEMLAVTFIVREQVSGDIVAYYSLLNDTIRFGNDDKAVRNRINRKIPHSKQRNSYPAIKLGRLAVDERFAGKGIGMQILREIAYLYVNNEKSSGCRFITVDAVASAIGFYERFGFRLFTERDANEDTRQMYFDLLNAK